jgi:hypothetical protein
MNRPGLLATPRDVTYDCDFFADVPGRSTATSGGPVGLRWALE